MHSTSSVIYFSLLVALVYCQYPEVTTNLGTIAGETVIFSEDSFLGVKKKVDVYKGIPYAEPPMGDLRFEIARAKKAWNGTLNATEFGPLCLQISENNVIGEDDCLYLNIFVPQSKSMKAAVMFYIHGGGFSTGTGSSNLYSGIVLAATGDVIVVTINYRLNIYGFLTTGDDEYPGNIGLFDQLEALKWVNANIAAFGGNPSGVTIFGQSAGSASVDYHLLSKQSWSYFNQAILQSGTSLGFWAYAGRGAAQHATITLGEMVGCNYTESRVFVKCLKAIDPQIIFKIMEENFRHPIFPLYLEFGPVVDGVFLEQNPEILIRNGEFKKNAAIMIGTNEDEGTLPYIFIPEYQSLETPEVSKSKFIDLIPKVFVPTDESLNPLILDSIYFEYTDWSLEDDPEADYFQSGVRLTTEFWFLCPSDAVQRAHASAGNNVYVYLMTYTPSVFLYGFPWLGAGHAEEIPFVFGLPFLKSSSFFYQSSDADRNMTVLFLRYWSNFAKTGDPNNSGSETVLDPSFDEDLANWPTYNLPRLEYLNINSISSTERAYKADKCAFWNMYQPKLEQFSDEFSEIEISWRNDYHNWKYYDLPKWQKTFNDYQDNKGN